MRVVGDWGPGLGRDGSGGVEGFQSFSANVMAGKLFQRKIDYISSRVACVPFQQRFKAHKPIVANKAMPHATSGPFPAKYPTVIPPTYKLQYWVASSSCPPNAAP